MGKLKYTQQKHIETKFCEICGAEFVTGYGYSLAACWLVTGHAHVASYMCEQAPGNQHWGCSPEHAIEAMLACLEHDEHMSATRLRAKHAEMETQGKYRVSEEDKHIVEALGSDFPFVKRGK
jgi:hypothetical protein